MDVNMLAREFRSCLTLEPPLSIPSASSIGSNADFTMNDDTEFVPRPKSRIGSTGRYEQGARVRFDEPVAIPSRASKKIVKRHERSVQRHPVHPRADTLRRVAEKARKHEMEQHYRTLRARRETTERRRNEWLEFVRQQPVDLPEGLLRARFSVYHRNRTPAV
ncbi:hypothetical protein NEOLEDRAFT_1132192 [Neolentinus lepideus HHB14362 ss-1]|uniref:Uncharacterized protein n=1 Tax=Neolentinus lepideus HHB14362 ss-1 TaxID=1314782 RepID=A0A165TGL1_9AGAM|nr:hypothetical protein NEOLEDRAFT_1132192 [Neolentinus lepideus HHB14362 ss-1]